MKHILCVIGIWILKALLCLFYGVLKIVWALAWLLSYLVGWAGGVVSGIVLVIAVLFFIFSGVADGLKVIGLLLAVTSLPYVAEEIITPLDNFTDRVFHWLMA